MATSAANDDEVTPHSEGGSDVGDHKVADQATYICPDCGAPMIVIDTFARGQLPRAPPMLNGGGP